MDGLSFREKSLWLMLASLAGGFALYAASVWTADVPNVLPQHVAAFAAMVVLLVVVQVVGHAAIALLDRRTETDERDRLIELKGTRVGAYVLATGVFLALCVALMTQGNFVFTHVLLAFWVFAQLADIVTQLVLQRVGA